MTRARVALALVHHPVLARDGSESTSTITNLDVHDLARSAKTYALSDYFLVHPVAAQRELAERIIGHWKTGSSGERIPSRAPALELVRPVATLDDAIAALGGRERVTLWTTAARASRPVLSYADARSAIAAQAADRATLVVFGTSWGLAPRVLDAADASLAPIEQGAEYNHLSVRAACAIILDRLLGHP